MSEAYSMPGWKWSRSSNSRRKLGRTRKSRSCSCRTSSAITGRATRRCTCSTASSLRSGRGSRLRWSRHRAPASRRCCTSPACSSIPITGDVYIDGRSTSILADHERTRIRRNEIGFVYQSHHLLPEFSALENVMLPQMIRGLARAPRPRPRAVELLNYLGLGGRLKHRPAELSGGEQQRVAIARAVANAPRILLADEPTGNLDLHTAEHVFRALSQLVRASGLAAIIATHNMDLAARMDRRVTLARRARLVEMD